MKRIFILTISAVILSACSRKISVQKVQADSNLQETFFYALPRNTLNLEIRIKETVLKSEKENRWSGLCIKKLAEMYELNPADLKKMNGVKSAKYYGMYKDSIFMNLGAKPDLDKVYAVNVYPKFFMDNVVGLSFTGDYLLSEASITSENKAYEIGLSAVSTVLGAITTLAKGDTLTNKKLFSECGDYTKLDKAIQEYAAYLTNPNLPFNSEAYQGAKSYWTKRVEKERNKAFFEKTEKVHVVKFSLDIADKMPEQAVRFFRLNPETGMIEINDQFRNRVKPQLHQNIVFVAANGNDWYTLGMEKHRDDVFTKVTGNNTAPVRTSGLVYNVPATATFILSKPASGGLLFSNTYKIAQFGTTGSINPKFTKAAITLDPITGSLLKAGGESKSIASSNITGTGELVGKAKEAFGKPTEVEELERQAKILELKAKIRELESKE